jgi:hypothetical protein
VDRIIVSNIMSIFIQTRYHALNREQRKATKQRSSLEKKRKRKDENDR